MKKSTKIIIAVVAVAMLVGGSIFGFQKYEQYMEATYLLIDDIQYRRDVTELDLSGSELREMEKLFELTKLERLNLRDTGITIEDYNTLTAALPNCIITWSVPFQGSYMDCTTTELDLAIITAEDLDMLVYFPDLTLVKAETSRNYSVITELQERYPQLTVSYTVELGGKLYNSTVETLDVSNPLTSELLEKMVYLPDVTTVNLTGQIPSNEEMRQLQQTFANVTFIYDFELFGIATNSMAEFLDLSNIKFNSPEEVDAIMTQFYQMGQIDMINCGLKNAEMDALNKRYPDTKIVWKVNVCGVDLRTDALHFMPVQHNCPSATGAQCYNLRYCTDMQVVDLGHYGTNDLSFVEHMPNLKYLLVCEGTVTDATPLGNCLSLEYLELQNTRITDFWPLTNLTNLRDLNVAGSPWFGGTTRGTFAEGDMTALTQMTWLDRLWLPYTRLSREKRDILREALPNTMIVFESSGATTSGYRHTPRYYAQRDILGMYYGCN